MTLQEAQEAATAEFLARSGEATLKAAVAKFLAGIMQNARDPRDFPELGKLLADLIPEEKWKDATRGFSEICMGGQGEPAYEFPEVE